MSTALDNFLNREMQRYGLRISPRLSPYERAAQYVRLMMERRGEVLNETDVEVVANMILLRYPIDATWVEEMLETQLTEPFRQTRSQPMNHCMKTRSMTRRG